MTLLQLRYMIAVADNKSINEAAKSLYISQPSLSAAIKELEGELGIPVFKRTNRGIITTPEGEEFLGYARQIAQQAQLLEERYANIAERQKHFSVSSQHYTFAANAFVNLIKRHGNIEYKFAFRETTTHGVITDVRLFRSELGVIFLNEYNQLFIKRLLKEGGLEFSQFCETRPYVYVRKRHPLAKRSLIGLADLADYPAIMFDQGSHNSFYLSEEVVNHGRPANTITVSDRAALFDLLVAGDAYAVSTGIYVSDPTVTDIASIPLDMDIAIYLGVIHHKDVKPTDMAMAYREELNSVITEYTQS